MIGGSTISLMLLLWKLSKVKLWQKSETVKKQTPAYYLQSNKSANMHLLQQNNAGLKPKWYAVIHFNDAGNSKRQLEKET